ncbi:MAG: hypothetical protein ABSA16_08840 [Thermoguttaceae bacterium]|jgi:hypothetical protein
MSILQNAVDSISLGIEDYNNPDPRRLISCTRNIFAGILLLFKHKLAELSPPASDEALIKQMVVPHINAAAGILWHGKGKKTVDVQKIRERFDSLGITVDWNRVEKINNYRNDVEHYFSSLSQSAIQAIISDCFIVIRDFVRFHLGQEPLSLLGSDTWTTLTKVNEVYETEKQECISHIMEIDWKYNSLQHAIIDYRCENCGSGLIDVRDNRNDRCETNFFCRSCGKELSFEEIAPLAISEYFSGDNYLAIKDGDYPVTILCPLCGRNTYVLDEDVCVMCDESVERECQRCGIEIPPSEIDGEGYCDWCAHMMSKDD